MDFTYHIFSDLELILECYIGDHKYKDLFECKRMEMKDPDWRSHYNVLGDIRKGSILFSDQDIVNIHKYIENNPEINAKRKSAILTYLPGQVVFGTFLKGYNNSKISLIIPEVFSTIDAALAWLGVNSRENERIEEMLGKLSGDLK